MNNTDELPTLRFSAMWSEKLGEAIKERAPEIYHMSLVGEDKEALEAAVNQGIDSHLEACYVPDRGDSFEHTKRTITATEDTRFWSAGDELVLARALDGNVSRESLPTLVRRLMELETEAGDSLASDICSTIGIELV